MTVNPAIGIMQGRLVPPDGATIQQFPRGRWREEFAGARRAGLQAIEWIYDSHGAGVNPLETTDGIAEIRALAAASGVAVRSICADYFMEHPLEGSAGADRRWVEQLEWVLGQASILGAGRIVLPFVDAASIGEVGARDRAAAAIRAVLPAAERYGIELHLETGLGPADFRGLLDTLPHRLIRVNYDSGNSASLGYEVGEEFAAYGDRVGSVHVKDRVRGGGTVPLGTGDADLPGLAACLHRMGYAGDVVLQVARGGSGEEVAWAQHNREIVERIWRQEGAWTSV
jgi:hexulose-6-phosphate isomerase